MAKFDTDDIGKPGKPPTLRRFPWRLWLYAVVMTGAAGAGGWFWWQAHKEAQSSTEQVQTTGQKARTCEDSAAKLRGDAEAATKAKDSCLASLSDNYKKTKELETQLASNTSSTTEELAQLRAQRAETDKRLAAIGDIQKQFARMIDTGQLKVAARRGSLILSLPSEVLFPSGVAELSKQGELAVLEVGITLKRFPDRRFLVIGHTDDAPLKSATYKDNWELSTARALTVTRFLVQAGMDPKNILPSGSGEHDPIAKDRAKNRRIEIALLPAISELPPLPASIPTEVPIKVEADLPPAAPAPATPAAPPATTPPPARP